MISFEPIGYIYTKHQLKFHAPHQPSASDDSESTIELLPNPRFEHAVKDLEGFERIWLISWFHKNSTWRPKVLPPRGPPIRRGVFATRSPHRPNPIGLTSVQLKKIEGRIITVGHTDLIDGTPILDIKPYLPYADAFPNAKAGWVDEIEELQLSVPVYSIEISDHAKEQIEWLKVNWNIDFTNRAFEILSRDPTPHRTRRIKKLKDKTFRMGCGAWRINFKVENDVVHIIRIFPGFPISLLEREGYEVIPDREAQLQFLALRD